MALQSDYELESQTSTNGVRHLLSKQDINTSSRIIKRATTMNLLTMCLKKKPKSNQKRISQTIDNELKLDKKCLQKTIKILFLGTEESGKSTILQQILIIHGKKFTHDELLNYRSIIFENICEGMLILLEGREKLNEVWSNLELQSLSEKVKSQLLYWKSSPELIKSEKDVIFRKLVPDMRVLWQDEALCNTFSRRNELLLVNFGENVRYYLNRLEELSEESYLPTSDDIVWIRKATKRVVVEEAVTMNGFNFVFIDVGGQRAGRRKWCNLFSGGIHSLLYVVAASQFDESYLPGRKVNRDNVLIKTSSIKDYSLPLEHNHGNDLECEPINKLREALSVFENLVCHEAFITTSLIIFFNKRDVLHEKINLLKSNVNSHFPNFNKDKDPLCTDNVENFIVSLFFDAVNKQRSDKNPIGPVYRHFTTAVDRKNMETVFSAVRDSILVKNLEYLMMN